MQSAIRVPRGALLVLSATATLVVCYTSYHYFRQERHLQAPTHTRLQRSNAVRRRRREARAGSGPDESGNDPVSIAIDHLAQREASGIGYGFYRNKHYVQHDLLADRQEELFLLPSNFGRIQELLCETNGLSNSVAEQMRVHIQAMFVQEFLKEEFPEDAVLADVIDLLAQRLSSELVPELVIGFVRLRAAAAEFPTHHLFDPNSSQQNNDTILSEPEDIIHALSNNPNMVRQGAWDEYENQVEDGSNVKNLLYRIAEERAKWSGYQHRGVQCNGCGMQPIRGIRYHCANCWDYDLCEMCENQQIHHQTHVFYKIRIPAPTRGQIKLVQPKWYPGDPNACPGSIPPDLKASLLLATKIDRQDLDALYDQFRCIAGAPLTDDPDEIGMAIDRASFEKYFTSTTADRPPRSNLLYDRIYDFYDTDSDGLITFSEFAKGTADLSNNTDRASRIRRLFKAFDLDGDGFVSRKDFLHMLQANYMLNKELAYEVIFTREDVSLTDDEMREVIRGNNPISAAFGGGQFPGHRSRHGEGKVQDVNGDDVFVDNHMKILRPTPELSGDRAEAIARQASDVRSLIQGRKLKDGEVEIDDPVVTSTYTPAMPTAREEDSILASPRSDNQFLAHLGHMEDAWPIGQPQPEDVQLALGADVLLEDIMDPIDRRRILHAQQDRQFSELAEGNREVESGAVNDRWQRREFYTDVEQGFEGSRVNPQTNTNAVAALWQVNGTASPLHHYRPPTNTKPGHEVADEDTDVKSDISSEDQLAKERWAGLELSQPDRDVGVELVYEAVQEAFNEMLNHIFKEKEDRAMDAQSTRSTRRRYRAELHDYMVHREHERLVKENQLLQADQERTEALFRELLSAPDSDAENPTLQKQPSEIALDPTLPQHRPNEEDIHSRGTSTSRDTKIPFDEALLALWSDHEKIDEEARIRGGHGRLNFQELKQKFRDDNPDIDIGGEGDEENYWEATADLGKFSFLSDWIEMASF